LLCLLLLCATNAQAVHTHPLTSVRPLGSFDHCLLCIAAHLPLAMPAAVVAPAPLAMPSPIVIGREPLQREPLSLFPLHNRPPPSL